MGRCSILYLCLHPRRNTDVAAIDLPTPVVLPIGFEVDLEAYPVHPEPMTHIDDSVRVYCYTIAMSSVDRLFEEAVQLPEDQRLTLVYRLLASSEPPVTEASEQAWDVAIRERIQRYDQGKVRSRPAGDVFSGLDRKLKK